MAVPNQPTPAPGIHLGSSSPASATLSPSGGTPQLPLGQVPTGNVIGGNVPGGEGAENEGPPPPPSKFSRKAHGLGRTGRSL